jgi:hypothetical protein
MKIQYAGSTSGNIHPVFKALSSSFLQVGMKTQYTGPQGQLSLFFGNKSSQPLERLLCNFPPSPQFQWQMGSLPQRIEAKKQTVVSHEDTPFPYGALCSAT